MKLLYSTSLSWARVCQMLAHLSLSVLRNWQHSLISKPGSEKVRFPQYHTVEEGRVSLAPVLTRQLWTSGHRRPYTPKVSLSEAL